MSVEASELSQPNDGSDPSEPRRFSVRSADTGVDADVDDGADVERDDFDEDEDDTMYRSADNQDVVDQDAEDPQPTFTPADTDPATGAFPTPRESADGPVVQGEVVTDAQTEPDTLDDGTAAGPVPVTTAPVQAAAVDPNAPLLGDLVTLQASWQQAQAGFVDDPRAAVSDAAELVEHTAQTLIGALQQRQRQLRGQWETGTTAVDGSDTAAAAPSGSGDTEQLRHLMQDYRALFNQLCHS